jgi:hypothetical protein
MYLLAITVRRELRMQARAAYLYISGLIGGGRYSDDIAL